MTSSVPPEYRKQHPLSMDRGRQAGEWFQANARAVGVAGAALAVVAVGALAWRGSEQSKAQRAETALYQAEAGLAPGGDARQAERALRDVATRYGGTAGGTQAQLLLTQTLYESGRYQDGLAVLGRGKPPAEFADAVRLLTAAGYEGLGRGADAARVYEQLANASRLPARRRGELQAAAARAYQLANDRGGALRAWRAVMSSGTGPLMDEARIRVGELASTAS